MPDDQGIGENHTQIDAKSMQSGERVGGGICRKGRPVVLATISARAVFPLATYRE
jgi:hypothetical protein